MNRVFEMFSRRKSDVNKEDSENALSSRGSMSIRDLIAPSETNLKNKEDGKKFGDTGNIINNNITLKLGKKRGRPRKDGKMIYSEYTRRYRKKTYIDTPEVRQRISDLEKIIDEYDESFRRSGRPRRRPLKFTLTRKKVATLPPDIQANCQEYLDLKRQLPPTKTLGRPRKKKDNAEDSEQNYDFTTNGNEGKPQQQNNTSPVDQGTSLNPVSSIPNTTERHSSTEINNKKSITTPTISKDVAISIITNNVETFVIAETPTTTIPRDVETPTTTISKIVETPHTITPKDEPDTEFIPETITKKVDTPTNTVSTPTNTISNDVEISLNENVTKPKRKYRKRTAEEKAAAKIPRKRGRPRKVVNDAEQVKPKIAKPKKEIIKKPPAKRGRPRKHPIEEPTIAKRSIGRPRKAAANAANAGTTEASQTTPPPVPSSSNGGIAKGKRNSKNSRNARNAHLDPIQRLHYAIASDLKMRNKFQSHFKDCKNEAVSWGFLKQEAGVHVSKIYLAALINPGLKDSV